MPRLTQPSPKKTRPGQAIPSGAIVTMPKVASIIPAASSFVATKTSSGRSLGSVGHYSTDWNNADTNEITSGTSEVRPHPAGPSNLAQKMHTAKLALIEADKAAMVRFYLYYLLFFANNFFLSPLVPEV
jgi:hypothetical protein